MTKQDARTQIEKLVARFEAQYASYQSKDYNETSTRKDFIDPFFEALGWDMNNKNDIAEAYREVIHEDKIKIGGATKAPDYGFRIGGGKSLFYVEAKKPSITVHDDIHPAYQLRRYGWNAKLSISLLTDFEEFAIYDCTKKPRLNDRASTARIKYLTYKDYLTEFDFLWDTFSKDAVLKGSFDTFVLSSEHKRGKDTVDKEFLESLDSWRTLLAKAIHTDNPGLNEDEITFAVQQTLDRIIFLRIAEDRGVEIYENLKSAINHGNYYQNLLAIFRTADEKYNSGLFNFKTDTITSELKIANDVIKKIISEFYYPLSPYEFSVLSVEIIGSAYEQFLGKVIRLTSSGNVKIEEKPEVRKAGGVYYTPQYIVDYIVKNTVGTIVEGKTPKEVSKIKIVDPACGSGSFLIGAYQYLLDWHKNYYKNRQSSRKNNQLTPEGELTTTEKKNILLNNIFGVDIDKNAVEVTKLSLLLKCMEGETQASISHQMKIFHERVLPTLDKNIKSGNSLIDTDFYDNQLNLGFEQKIKPFNWKKEFPDVFINNGFDIIIGNPPWVSLNGKFGNDILPPTAQHYLITKYQGNTYRPNLYEYFIHKGLELMNNKSLFSFIVPDRLGFNDQFVTLRTKILSNTKIEELLYKAPFPGIVTDTLVFRFASNNKPGTNYLIDVGEYGKKFQKKSANAYFDDYEKKFSYENNEAASTIIKKIFSMNNVQPLGEIIESKTGVILDTKQVTTEKINKKQIQIAKGRSIGAYQFLTTFFCEFSTKTIKGGTNDKNKLGTTEKVLLRKTGIPIIATYDNNGIFPEQSLYFLINNRTPLSLKYFTALINSNVFQFIYINKLVTNKDSTPQLKKVDLDKFPVYVMNLNNKIDKESHDAIIHCVDQLLTLNKNHEQTRLHTQITQIQNTINHFEETINKIIYKLYGLSIEEINTIEKQIRP